MVIFIMSDNNKEKITEYLFRNSPESMNENTNKLQELHKKQEEFTTLQFAGKHVPPNANGKDVEAIEKAISITGIYMFKQAIELAEEILEEAKNDKALKSFVRKFSSSKTDGKFVFENFWESLFDKENEDGK